MFKNIVNSSSDPDCLLLEKYELLFVTMTRTSHHDRLVASIISVASLHYKQNISQTQGIK